MRHANFSSLPTTTSEWATASSLAQDIDALLTPPPVKLRPQDDSYPLSCYYIS